MPMVGRLMMMLPTLMTLQAGRDAAPDRTGNGSAAGLSRQRCGHQQERADSTKYGKLAEHTTATCPIPVRQPS
jgi:hypothetical protein